MKSYKLFIKGLDEQMDEGIPDKHIVLLTGTPGTMKSSISYNFLYKNGKENGTVGLYLTLEQDKENFGYQLKKLGMGEANEQTHLFDMSTTREEWLKLSATNPSADIPDLDLATFKRQIEVLKNHMKFDLLVIDSLPVAEMMFRMKDPREDLFHFFKWLKKLNVTTILISEMKQDSPEFSKHDVDFLADGIIKVSIEKLDPTTSQRQIEIVKMRGVNHSTNPFTLNFKNGSFEATRVLI